MDLSQNTASTSSSSLIWGTAVPGKRKGSTRGHGIFHRDVGTLEIDLSSDDSQPSANDDEVDSFEDQTEPSSIDSASSEGSTRQDQDSESDPWEGQREKSRSNGTVGSNSRQVQKSSKSNTTTGDHAGQLRHPKRPKRAAEPAAAVRHLGFQQTAVSRATLSIAGSRYVQKRSYIKVVKVAIVFLTMCFIVQARALGSSPRTHQETTRTTLGIHRITKVCSTKGT